MKAKEFLSQYFAASIKEQIAEKELESLRQSMSDIKAKDYSKVAVDGTRSTDKIGDLVARIQDEEKKVLDTKVLARKQLVDVIRVIGKIEDPLVMEVLYRRFNIFETWERIGYEMCYSVRHVHNLKVKGYKETERILSEDRVWKS